MTKLCFTVPGFQRDVDIFHGTGSLEVRAPGKQAGLEKYMCVKVCVLFMLGDFFLTGDRSL